MKIYTEIQVDCDPKVIGVNNGVYQFEIEAKQFVDTKNYESFVLGFKDEDATRKYLRTERTFLSAKLLKRAKDTDFMVYSPYLKGIPFAVSKRALEILTRFNLGEYYVIEVAFVSSEISNHFLIWFSFTEADSIIFKESILYGRGPLTVPKEYQTVNSFEDYFSRRFKLDFEKVVLDKSLVMSDFLSIRGVGDFVSESLKNALLDEGICAVKFPAKIVVTCG